MCRLQVPVVPPACISCTSTPHQCAVAAPLHSRQICGQILLIPALRCPPSFDLLLTPPCRSRRWLLVLRGVLGFASVSSLYLAVALLPLADASVLSFLSPIFVAALR